MFPSLRVLVSTTSGVQRDKAYPFPAKYKQFDPSSALVLATHLHQLSETLTPEWHADARALIEHCESPDRLWVAWLPQRNLALAHAREARRCDTVMLAHPHSPAILCALVARMLADRPFLAHVPHPELLVARGSGEQGTGRVPGQTLHDIVVAEHLVRLAGLDVPELDREIARGGGEDVLGGGVEDDLSDFSRKELVRGWGEKQTCGEPWLLPRMAGELRDGADVGHLLGVDVEGEVLGDLPDEDPGIIRTRGDDIIVEGVPGRGPELAYPMRTAREVLWGVNVPVGVQNSSGMAPEQRNQVGQLPPLLEREDSKRAAAAGLPIDGEVLGIDLYQAHMPPQFPPVLSGCQGRCAGKSNEGSRGSGRGRRIGRDRGVERGFYLYEVGVPGILANVEVVVALVLPGGLAEDVSWRKLSSAYDAPIVAHE